ncbi:hypothetical protein SLEP1_g18471 [Rubroshorea leprosula]|uniref:Uncharacterized protein n=1 Tax=Rubroshorea leprosula TaxID=152421 RepID=A0AAV5J872_9ROSI|nr:hypothetical protein SLEP1_g18471 [Rubroshorea leprosula]
MLVNYPRWPGIVFAWLGVMSCNGGLAIKDGNGPEACDTVTGRGKIPARRQSGREVQCRDAHASSCTLGP